MSEPVALVPLTLVTLTSTAPAEPAGLVAVIVEPLTTVTPVAAFEPKSTVEPEVKCEPLMVTPVPPPRGPVFGLTPVTAGNGLYVKRSEFPVVLVPPGVETVRCTGPGEPEGDVAVHEVVVLQLTEVPAALPNKTEVEPITKAVPVIVTTVPPLGGPDVGEIDPTEGSTS